MTSRSKQQQYFSQSRKHNSAIMTSPEFHRRNAPDISEPVDVIVPTSGMHPLSRTASLLSSRSIATTGSRVSKRYASFNIKISQAFSMYILKHNAVLYNYQLDTLPFKGRLSYFFHKKYKIARFSIRPDQHISLIHEVLIDIFEMNQHFSQQAHSFRVASVGTRSSALVLLCFAIMNVNASATLHPADSPSLKGLLPTTYIIVVGREARNEYQCKSHSMYRLLVNKVISCSLVW